jgi:hypothetical protein
VPWPRDYEENTFLTKPKVGDSLRKVVCGVLFHPVFDNLVLVLTEGGEIHAIDTL